MPTQVRTAHLALKLGFVAALLLAGTDKHLHLLVDWDKYLCPLAQHILGRFSHPFMLLGGAGEILCALLLLVPAATRYIAYFLSFWMLCIVVDLILCGQYYDIALRDLGLSIAAFALAKLTEALSAHPRPQNT